jgi:hypothetical protein
MAYQSYQFLYSTDNDFTNISNFVSWNVQSSGTVPSWTILARQMQPNSAYPTSGNFLQRNLGTSSNYLSFCFYPKGLLADWTAQANFSFATTTANMPVSSAGSNMLGNYFGFCSVPIQSVAGLTGSSSTGYLQTMICFAAVIVAGPSNTYKIVPHIYNVQLNTANSTNSTIADIGTVSNSTPVIPINPNFVGATGVGVSDIINIQVTRSTALTTNGVTNTLPVNTITYTLSIQNITVSSDVYTVSYSAASIDSSVILSSPSLSNLYPLADRVGFMLGESQSAYTAAASNYYFYPVAQGFTLDLIGADQIDCTVIGNSISLGNKDNSSISNVTNRSQYEYSYAAGLAINNPSKNIVTAARLNLSTYDINKYCLESIVLLDPLNVVILIGEDTVGRYVYNQAALYNDVGSVAYPSTLWSSNNNNWFGATYTASPVFG